MTLAALIGAARDGRWLTRARVVVLGQILLLVELTVLILLALWQHGITSAGVSRTSSDFVSFYAAGKLALAGTPALAYDQAAHFLAEQRFMVDGAPYQYFFYPPVFLLLCAPLALLPYHVAFYTSEIGTLTALLVALRRILREPDWGWVAPVLAFPAVFWTFGLGQNAFLTAALFAGCTARLDRRPMSAGALLGMLCYKPHFGLLAPLGLVAGGYWRACFAAAATVVALVALSAGLFGAETWRAYLTAFAGSDAVYAAGRIDYAGIVTPFGAARLLGLAPSAAYLAQAAATVAAMALVVWSWHQPGNAGPRAAVLLSATLLAVPLALLYDRMLLLVAIVWLVRDAARDGFLAWEKITLALVWLLSLGEYAIASAVPLPLGPAITAAVLALALRRVAASRAPIRDRATPELPAPGRQAQAGAL